MIFARYIPVCASALVSAVILVSTGCHSKAAPTPENFTAALNAHFLDHPDCLFPELPHFPLETTDPVKTKQLNTLVTNQLLAVTQERELHASRYTLTTTGTRYAPRFCFGHRAVTSIESSTPPAPANGFSETQVVYRYTMEEVPVWAKSADVQAAFPAMAEATSGSARGKATLAGAMTGWQVPD